MATGMKGQKLPVMAAVAVSLSLHVLAGCVFLKMAWDLPNHRFVPPIEFFVVPPIMLPVTPQVERQPTQQNVARQHLRQVTTPMPVVPPNPIIASPTVTSQQHIETVSTSSPVPPFVASAHGKEPTILHSAGPSSTAAPKVSSTSGVALSVIEGSNDSGSVIGPSYNAGYLHNPVPPYPAVARKLKLQGTAIVRVLVTPDGQPKNVALEKTSGVRILDETAVETVKHWSFVPARQGNNHIAARVDVPIRFRLD